MMTAINDIRAIFEDAQAKRDAAEQAKKAMALVMLQAFQNLIPPDSILDLRFSRENPPPAHLSHVRTMRGNDRGTKVFRIVSVVAVEADPGYPDLSRWIADAVPISEKTGKDMKASTGHSSGKETVRLHGAVGCDHGPAEHPSAAASRVIELVALHCDTVVV